jgi:hypothetical protein
VERGEEEEEREEEEEAAEREEEEREEEVVEEREEEVEECQMVELQVELSAAAYSAMMGTIVIITLMILQQHYLHGLIFVF